MRARVQAGGGAIMVLYFMFVTGVVLNTCRYVKIMFMMICKKYFCCIYCNSFCRFELHIYDLFPLKFHCIVVIVINSLRANASSSGTNAANAHFIS